MKPINKCRGCKRRIPITPYRTLCRLCHLDGGAGKRDISARKERKRISVAQRPIFKMLTAARQRAKRKSIPFNLVVADIRIPEFCPILGIPLRSTASPGGDDRSPSLDRIKADLGYVPGNVVVISNRANRIKNDSTVEELEKIASFYRALAS